MLALVINYGAVAAFLFFATGTVLQLKRVWKRKSSADISISELLLRIAANFLLAVKVFVLKDPYLMTGAAILIPILLLNLCVVIKYRKTQNPSA